MMVFYEIDNFIEVYNNSVIELIQCFGTSFFGLNLSNIFHDTDTEVNIDQTNTGHRP